MYLILIKLKYFNFLNIFIHEKTRNIFLKILDCLNYIFYKIKKIYFKVNLN